MQRGSRAAAGSQADPSDSEQDAYRVQQAAASEKPEGLFGAQRGICLRAPVRSTAATGRPREIPTAEESRMRPGRRRWCAVAEVPAPGAATAVAKPVSTPSLAISCALEAGAHDGRPVGNETRAWQTPGPPQGQPHRRLRASRSPARAAAGSSLNRDMDAWRRVHDCDMFWLCVNAPWSADWSCLARDRGHPGGTKALACCSSQ